MSSAEDAGPLNVWPADVSAVGATRVLRALPHPGAEAVGPFVFLDHFGPIPTKPGTLPAHPHAGIEVMTYLLAGSNEHRDSAGHMGRVQAGGAQWMRAGRGVLHSERILDDAPIVHGLQLWARMPVAMQDAAPSYRGIAAEEVPSWQAEGAAFRLLAGTWQGHVGPISLSLPAFMLHITLTPGAAVTIDLPEVAHEYGVYAIESSGDGLCVGVDTVLRLGDFAQLAANQTRFSCAHDLSAQEPAQLFVLGGEPAPRPLVFGGPFVFESQASLRRANQRFAAGDMGTLDGVPY